VADRNRVADDDVRAGVGAREEAVDARTQRCAEHQRAGEEGDTEEDCGEDAGEAALVGAEAGEAHAEHGYRPTAVIRSNTCVADGRSRWSTIRPSASSRAASAYPAAVASWVTMMML